MGFEQFFRVAGFFEIFITYIEIKVDEIVLLHQLKKHTRIFLPSYKSSYFFLVLTRKWSSKYNTTFTSFELKNITKTCIRNALILNLTPGIGDINFLTTIKLQKRIDMTLLSYTFPLSNVTILLNGKFYLYPIHAFPKMLFT